MQIPVPDRIELHGMGAPTDAGLEFAGSLGLHWSTHKERNHARTAF